CALLVLFCSQSVKDLVSPFQEASIKMHPEISPRLLPESECKGTAFLFTDQIFRQLFLKFFEKRRKRGGKQKFGASLNDK
ncbi:MAG: hypothetical protein IKH80_07925, partial [Bacteroidaceae bacterium]|nr:hypothetical protein [Bacteroidaceae bacterium]